MSDIPRFIYLFIPTKLSSAICFPTADQGEQWLYTRLKALNLTTPHYTSTLGPYAYAFDEDQPQHSDVKVAICIGQIADVDGQALCWCWYSWPQRILDDRPAKGISIF